MSANSREAVNDRGLFTAGWFSVREKYCSRLKIYDRLRASEHAALFVTIVMLDRLSFMALLMFYSLPCLSFRGYR